MTLHDAPLAGVFPQGKEEDWRKIVDRALKGAPFEKLISKTYDGVAIAPLYPRATAPGPRALRAAPGRWSILPASTMATPSRPIVSRSTISKAAPTDCTSCSPARKAPMEAASLDDSDEAIAQLFAELSTSNMAFPR